MERTELERREVMFTNKRIFQLLWPVLIEQALASTVGIADTIMVSNVGDTAVSAVGLIDTINNMFIQIFSAISVGATVIIAQLSGRGDQRGVKRTVSQTVALMTLVMTSIALCVLLFGSYIVDILYPSIETAVRDNALTYFRLTALSYPFFGMMTIITGIFRGNGNTQTPMRISLGVNFVNVGLNALFIFGLDMGVAGAALATLLARVVGMLLMTRSLLKKYGTDVLKWVNLRFTKAVLKPVLNISLPSGFDTALFQSGRLIISVFVGTMTTAQMSGNTIANSMFGLICIPGMAFCIVATTVTGQCYGAGRRREARRNLLKCIWIAVALLSALSVVLYFIVPHLVDIYNPSADAKPVAISILHLYLVMIPLTWPPAFVSAHGLRAVNDVRFVTSISIPSMWIMRVIGAWFLGIKLGMGPLGLNLAMCLDWVVRTVVYVPRIAMLKRLKTDVALEPVEKSEAEV
ncbi:MAG: MATE family efflux transporter [Clostridia bacterium]|nr:MATE family efflux transporter [Clostridia bacterium]